MARFTGCWEYPSKMISYSPAGSGLANRMNSIYACHRSSDEVHVYWERGNKSIFDYGSPKFYFPDVIETRQLNLPARNNWRMGTRKGELPAEFSNKQRIFRRMWKLEQIGPTDGASIDFEYHRIPLHIREDYCKVIKSIRIADMFLELSDGYSNKMFSDDTMGVHIRSFIDSPEHKNRNWCGVDRYISLMDEHHQSKFFVATDDGSIIKTLKDYFGEDRIITREQNDNKIDVFLEMLLLAKCSSLILSPFSTFSQLAWFLGGATVPVKVPYKQPDWLVY
jgi:hypothetical protein